LIFARLLLYIPLHVISSLSPYIPIPLPPRTNLDATKTSAVEATQAPFNTEGWRMVFRKKSNTEVRISENIKITKSVTVQNVYFLSDLMKINEVSFVKHDMVT
jgi:hypothetical protein